MGKIRSQDFTFSATNGDFRCTSSYHDTPVTIAIDTDKSDFDAHGELYCEQIESLFARMPLIYQQAAATHLDQAQVWADSGENGTVSVKDTDSLSHLFKVEHINFHPKEEVESKSNPYPCWWYFELYIKVEKDIFADHGLLIRLDRNLDVLTSDIA